ncbi:MAG: DUF898 domain-containing protein [Nitrosomonas sp.]|nr:DUF898 domain-containing protein [Nitrosomonas sp.]
MSTIVTDQTFLDRQITEEAQPERIRHHLTTHRIAYDGQTGQVYKIWLLNIVMNIFTLGIYSFWGKTRLRQYVAGAFKLNKDRFEYTGTGKELFIGFLKAMLIFLVLYLPFMVASIIAPDAVWPLVFLIPFFYVLPVALYSAWRYRISRTQWRSIRFELDGSVMKFAGLFLWRWLINIVSLGLFIPYSDIKIYQYVTDNAYYGDIAFRFEGRGKDLMAVHLATYSIIIGLFIFALYGLQLMAASFAAAQMALTQQKLSVDEALVIFFSNASFFSALACTIVPFILLPMVRLIYKTALIHEITNHLYAGEVGFRSTVTTFALIKLKLGNLLILILTFGLGLPVIMQRNLRFFAQHTQVRGDLETSSIKQTANHKPADAEGLHAVMGLDSGLI